MAGGLDILNGFAGKYYLVNSMIYLSEKNRTMNYEEYCLKGDSDEEDSYFYRQIFSDSILSFAGI